MKLLFNNHDKFNAEFVGSDTEELFKRNLQTMPPDWEWRHTTVKYSVNSQRYRCPEFETIDCSNSILMLGCSVVFGVGLDDSQICSKHLADLINKPVINLGYSGSSVMFHWANTCRLIENNINPRGVVYIWPQASRICEFQNDPNIMNHGPWSVGSKNNWAESWIMHPTHSTEFLKYAKISVSNMWKCPVLHYTSRYEDSQENNNLKFLKVIHDDHARDWNPDITGNRKTHPGPRTNRKWAEIIAQDIISVM